MALESIHSLTEMSTRSISWGQRRPVRKADNLPPFCTAVTKSRNLNFLEPSGHLRAYKGTALPFTSNRTLSDAKIAHVSIFYVYSFRLGEVCAISVNLFLT